MELTDDLSRYETGVPFHDPTVAALDRSYAARAFGKLPERCVVRLRQGASGQTILQVLQAPRDLCRLLAELR